jgi:hypothetical protein
MNERKILSARSGCIGCESECETLCEHAHRSTSAAQANRNAIKTPAERLARFIAHEPPAFPEASKSPLLPITIRDETLEFYACVFCQGGLRQLGMTSNNSFPSRLQSTGQLARDAEGGVDPSELAPLVPQNGA